MIVGIDVIHVDPLGMIDIIGIIVSPQNGGIAGLVGVTQETVGMMVVGLVGVGIHLGIVVVVEVAKVVMKVIEYVFTVNDRGIFLNIVPKFNVLNVVGTATCQVSVEVGVIGVGVRHREVSRFAGSMINRVESHPVD